MDLIKEKLKIKMKTKNISSDVALMDYIFNGISPEYQSEVISRYVELSFSVGRAMAEKKGKYKTQEADYVLQCKEVISRLLECEVNGYRLVPSSIDYSYTK
jgi:hypothetical protein